VSFAYLGALLVSIAGLGFLDWRYRVAVFDQARRALATIGIGVAVFLAWDVAGVGLGIFFRGEAGYMTGVQIAPEIPLEELFFLILLNYNTLLLWRALDRRRGRAGADHAKAAGSTP